MASSSPLRLSSPVTELHRVGPTKARQLKNLGIEHVRDFLYTFPRRYDDFSRVTPIANLQAGQQMTIRGRVKSVNSNYGYYGRRRVLRIFVELEDETGVVSITWYNLQFLPKQLWQGRELYVAGKIEEYKVTKNLQTINYRLQTKYRLRSPVLEFANKQELTHTGRITPVYPETYGVTSRFLRYQVKNALPLIATIPEYLPAGIRGRHKLINIHDAIKIVHFPDDADNLSQAQARLRFDELFFLQLAALVRRRQRAHRRAIAIPSNFARGGKQLLAGHSLGDGRSNALPFKLTSSQQRAAQEIFSDISQSTPMNRLLQGDVGSGKSAVALLAIQATLEAGYKVLYLAPTEVLARQQHDVLKKYVSDTLAALLIGSLPRRIKNAIKAKMLEPNLPLLIVGTHALLQEDVNVTDNALVIVDEQHRFGVAQRQALQSASRDGATPHLLSMTATPIPRTLNLTVFGDLDVSILDELPPGRQPILTQLVPPDKRDDAVIHILEQLHQGRQAYVIAPLVDESDVLEVKSAKNTFVEMQHLFPDIAVGLLHGQMSSEDKASVLNNFAAGALQLLVATTVVEVGVNVPNATIIIIEGAERFGLAQLHQLRGRVGRGHHQSFCYLFPSEAAAARSPRLAILTTTSDGFVIAEEDLKLRGPGEMYGLAQSGFGSLKVASLLDYATIKKTRTEAQRLLKEDPDLSQYPILRKKVEQKNLLAHFE